MLQDITLITFPVVTFYDYSDKAHENNKIPVPFRATGKA